MIDSPLGVIAGGAPFRTLTSAVAEWPSVRPPFDCGAAGQQAASPDKSWDFGGGGRMIRTKPVQIRIPCADKVDDKIHVPVQATVPRIDWNFNTPQERWKIRAGLCKTKRFIRPTITVVANR